MKISYNTTQLNTAEFTQLQMMETELRQLTQKVENEINARLQNERRGDSQ